LMSLLRPPFGWGWFFQWLYILVGWCTFLSQVTNMSSFPWKINSPLNYHRCRSLSEDESKFVILAGIESKSSFRGIHTLCRILLIMMRPNFYDTLQETWTESLALSMLIIVHG
jgi:hypothetical protein